jgi:transposase
MTPILLTGRQRAELGGTILRCPSARACCRAQALRWLAEGQPVEQIAELLHVSRQSGYNRVDRCRGRAGLDRRDRLADAPRSGRPRAGAGVVDPLISRIIDSDPPALGSRSTVWTAPLSSRYRRGHHPITVCDRTVSRAIARLGTRWKRPRHPWARRSATWRQSKGGSSAARRPAPAPCS